VSLPAVSTGETDRDDRPDRIVVAVAADGTIDLNGDIVTLGDLEDRLQAYPDRDRVSVILSADERARHGGVVAVMDRIRRAGILRLSIDTRPAPGLP
jgi:biopolymer transport protein ExbD